MERNRLTHEIHSTRLHDRAAAVAPGRGVDPLGALPHMNSLAALFAYLGVLLVLGIVVFASACASAPIQTHDGHTYKRIAPARDNADGTRTVEQWARIPVREGDPVYMRTVSGDFVRLGQHRVSRH